MQEEILSSTALPVPPRVSGRMYPLCTGGRGKPTELVLGCGARGHGPILPGGSAADSATTGIFPVLAAEEGGLKSGIIIPT